MRIIVRLFAGHRERAGASEVYLDLPQGTSVSDAFSTLVLRYPGLGEMESFTTFARNRQVVDPTEALADGDELALLQPVSGGEEGVPMIEITDQRLSLDRCVREVEGPDFGAIVTFLGTVRNTSEGRSTDHLEYEAYKEMTEEVIRRIVGEASGRWTLGKVAVQHRVGTLAIGEVSVVIAVSAPHRAEAFDGCRYVIDHLKLEAPIWKKEFGEAGEMWVGGPAAGGEEPSPPGERPL